MAIALRSIVTNIAAISVTGLTIYDLDDLKDALDVSACPVLYPDPVNFVTNLRVEMNSFEITGGAKKTIYYTLTYIFAYAPAGSGRGLFDKYPGMVDLAADILDALQAARTTISGSLLFDINTIAGFGPVADPAGNIFHGCQFLLDCQEFIN